MAGRIWGRKAAKQVWIVPFSGLAMLSWALPAGAAQLQFDSSHYTIVGTGSATLNVYVATSPGDPLVAPGNELLSASVDVSFNNSNNVVAPINLAEVTGR